MAKKRKPPSTEEMAAAVDRRSGFRFDQLPGLAMTGDRKALRQCAARVAVLVDKLQTRPEEADLKLWLLVALWDLQDGKSPAEAFGQAKLVAGRPLDFGTMTRQYAVVRSVEARLAENPDRDKGEVFEEVAGIYGATDETVATWYNHRTKPRNSVP